LARKDIRGLVMKGEEGGDWEAGEAEVER